VSGARRGKTRPGRLRRLDRYLRQDPALRAALARHPLAIDVGIGALAHTTHELAAVVADAVGSARRGRRPGRIHPATRTFQALRIAVNDELDALRTLLDDLPALLRPGGRAAIISFHTLEDRMVKHAFNDYARGGQGERLTKKPVTADEAAPANNPRARSAKLRAIRWTQPLPREANHIQ